MDRPFVYMNVAVTADGKIDTFERKGASISSARDWERVDGLRAEADAVMIGGRTLHGDDPKLTVTSEVLRTRRRERGLPENPVKVAVASRLHLKPECKFLMAGPARILLFTTSRTPQSQLDMLHAKGVEVHILDQQQVELPAVLHMLKQAGVQRLMVEGGATFNYAMLQHGLVDALTVFVAPLIFGGESAPTLAGGAGLTREAAIPLRLVKCEQWEDGGVLLHYMVAPER